MLYFQSYKQLVWLVIFSTIFLFGCRQNLRKFPLLPPMIVDNDMTHLNIKPKEYYSPKIWDKIDKIFFYQISKLLSANVTKPSINVNSFDELADSSWFINRIGTGNFSVDEVLKGACVDDNLNPQKKWTIIKAKPDGINPGFIIKGSNNLVYLLKFDGTRQPLRPSTADVFGSLVYHAAGYHTSCNFIVNFDPNILVISPKAKTSIGFGQSRNLIEQDVQKVLKAAYVLPNGNIRASASRFVSGKPIGPWKYNDTRNDDLNDVISHENRRELRANKLLAAWLNHFDTREQNTLATFFTDNQNKQYVRHYYIDFGDSFGAMDTGDIDPSKSAMNLSSRYGKTYYVDYAHIFTDFFSLGTIKRPWDTHKVSDNAPIFGYFNSLTFNPVTWKPAYQNSAFSKMQDIDGAWMARIIAFFTPHVIRAMLDKTELQVLNNVYDSYLFDTLVERREKILDHYLLIRTPLTHFELKKDDKTQNICYRDLAIMSKLTNSDKVSYEFKYYVEDNLSPIQVIMLDGKNINEDFKVCFPLINGKKFKKSAIGNSLDLIEKQYTVLDIHYKTGENHVKNPPLARIHLVNFNENNFNIVGVERPKNSSKPGFF